MPDPTDDDRRRLGRRSFFRSGFRELLKPLVESLDEKLTALNDVLPGTPTANSIAAAKNAPHRLPVSLLRPPGALPESDFLTTCSRCGNCVKACPAEAIKIVPSVAGGAPHIDANLAPCVVCTTLECMTVCPTEALVATPMKFIDMGTARWDPNSCLRPRGQDCRVCVDECPIGEVAIRLDEAGAVRVLTDGCVGCGVCQHRCPTIPKSILVEAKFTITV